MRKNLFKASLLLLLVFSLQLTVSVSAFADTLQDENALSYAKSFAKGDEKVEIVATQKKAISAKNGAAGLNPYTAIGSVGNASSWISKYSGGVFANPGASGTSETNLNSNSYTATVDAEFRKGGQFINNGFNRGAGWTAWTSGRIDRVNTTWEQRGFHQAFASSGYLLGEAPTYVSANF